MISYRLRRRAFIAAAGGGVGLKVMLRTLEGSAQGMRSPARLLVTHWPVGIVAGQGDALWRPTSGRFRPTSAGILARAEAASSDRRVLGSRLHFMRILRRLTTIRFLLRVMHGWISAQDFFTCWDLAFC